MAHPDTYKKLRADEEPVKLYEIIYKGRDEPVVVVLHESEWKNLCILITESLNANARGQRAIHVFTTGEKELIILPNVLHIRPAPE